MQCMCEYVTVLAGGSTEAGQGSWHGIQWLGREYRNQHGHKLNPCKQPHDLLTPRLYKLLHVADCWQNALNEKPVCEGNVVLI